ncbi:MAG: hydantoinase/oxoprolinase family protein [Chloroflexi bacterium]|nr:hydantoinase/oxoprolinase family protein [Chloroflexota bacterium]
MDESATERQFFCYIDTGGTFTDSFVVDENGRYIIGKAPSTPGNIAEGFFNSIESAVARLGISPGSFLSQLRILGYGTTLVLNALLTRTGKQPGLIITRGFEGLLLMERAKQTWTEYERIDRMHVVTHRHLDPLVPRGLIHGVTERIDCLGQPIIPLYEHEVREAARALIAKGVDAIVISFLWSFLQDAHERRAGALVREELAAAGKDLPVYLSVDVSPVMRELSRTNATVIEAYTAPLLKNAIEGVQRRLGEFGFRSSLQLMQSSGGLASAEHVKAVETVQSGPVGGLMGGRFIGELYGIPNIITTDAGGTSFDVGLVTSGSININREPVCARMILGVPVAEIISIGAGGGTIAGIDQLTGRLEVGPASAGAVPGPVCYDAGGTQPTVTDADLALGYLNPDYFIGGRIRLNKAKAEEAIRKQIAEPIGLSVVEAAAGIKRIIDAKMRNTIYGLVAARGLEISDYSLLSFGGAGPPHVAGYTADLPLRGVMMFPYSAAFSAFGAATADHEHHYTKALNMVVPPFAADEKKLELGEQLNRVWANLEQQALRQMELEGFDTDRITLRFLAMVRYGRQLNDLVVTSPVRRVATTGDWDALISAFEKLYDDRYARAARYPEAGFEIFEVGLIATGEKVKPKLEPRPLAGREPRAAARKGTRPAYFDGQMMPTAIYELGALEPGNVVPGPAIVEDPTTTFVVPPARHVEIDQYFTLWLK